MNLKSYLSIMAMATAICWSAWLFVALTIDPEITNWIGFLLFYTSLFLSIVGTAAIIGFIIRFVILKKHLAYYLVKEAFRQSFLFAILVIVSLILLSYELFTILNLFFLVLGLTILEFFMLDHKNRIG